MTWTRSAGRLGSANLALRRIVRNRVGDGLLEEARGACTDGRAQGQSRYPDDPRGAGQGAGAVLDGNVLFGAAPAALLAEACGRASVDAARRGARDALL